MEKSQWQNSFQVHLWFGIAKDIIRDFSDQEELRPCQERRRSHCWRKIFFLLSSIEKRASLTQKATFFSLFCSKRDITSFLWCARCFAKGSFTWEVILFSQKCPLPLNLLPLQTSFLGRTCPHTYLPPFMWPRAITVEFFFFLSFGSKDSYTSDIERES